MRRAVLTGFGFFAVLAVTALGVRRWLRPERTGAKTLDGRVIPTGRYLR